MVKQLLISLKNVVFTTVGHAVSGAVVSAAYGLLDYLPMVSTGQLDLASAALFAGVGAALGLTKQVIAEVEKTLPSKKTASGTCENCVCWKTHFGL